MTGFVSAGTFSAIPDSGLLYDLNPASLSLNDGDTVSSWDDDKSSETLTAVNSPTFKTGVVGDNPVVRLSGDAFDSGISDSQPIVWYFVVVNTAQSADFTRIVSDDDEDWFLQDRPNNNEMLYAFGASGIGGSTSETGLQLLTLESDGASSRLRRDASDIITGDAGSLGYGNLGFGYRRNQNDEFWDGDFVRLLGYDKSQMTSEQITDVESSLNDIYGIY